MAQIRAQETATAINQTRFQDRRPGPTNALQSMRQEVRTRLPPGTTPLFKTNLLQPTISQLSGLVKNPRDHSQPCFSLHVAKCSFSCGSCSFSTPTRFNMQPRIKY